MAEMTLSEIEQELERRNGLATDDLLTIGMQLFRANPEQLIEKSPSFANKLLELEARRLEIEASTHFSGDVSDYSNAQLQAHLYDGLQADDFWTLCQNGVDHLKTTTNLNDFDAFLQFLRAYVK